MPELIPYGIYTIPEISMVGQTEEKLTAQKVPYEVGVSKYAELAKSMMLGDETGMLKLLFDRNTKKAVRGSRHWAAGHGNHPYRASCARLWRHHRVFPRYGVQLSDSRRSLQSRRPRRPQ